MKVRDSNHSLGVFLCPEFHLTKIKIKKAPQKHAISGVEAVKKQPLNPRDVP
jgi:hypothetical protein